MKQVKCRTFTLYKPNGIWLGQICITSDGMFASVTDYGNFSYAWRAFGEDFEHFLSNINIDYFEAKITSGISYTVLPNKRIKNSIKLYAEHVLPALQLHLKENYNEY